MVTVKILWELVIPYPAVLSPISYDVPFIHSTCVTDDRQTDRR